MNFSPSNGAVTPGENAVIVSRYGQLDWRSQYVFYFALCLIMLAFTAALLPSAGADFRRFFGTVNPLFVVVAASVIGAVALSSLQSGFGFVVLSGQATLRGVAHSAAFASALAVAIVLADLIIRYPKDMNVPAPQALLFYPAVGFVAEIVFHVLPLAMLLTALGPLGGHLGRERVVWLSIFLVATLEPTFQVLFAGKALTWADAYSWIHVFCIAALQLSVFRRFDLASMYSFRLIYYAYWHVLWGVIRLSVLY